MKTFKVTVREEYCVDYVVKAMSEDSAWDAVCEQDMYPSAKYNEEVIGIDVAELNPEDES